MFLLSGNGTLRTILVLLIVWLLLRAWARSRQRQAPAQGAHWGRPDGRRPGEVRIERPEQGRPGHQGPVQDAEFEEIK
jgi:hypothetical protein